MVFNSHSYPRFTVKTTYGRKSGDPNTSIGNTIINALTFYNIFKRGSFVVSKAFMLGDDNLFASNVRFDKDYIISEYRKYGLDVKVNVVTSQYEAKFL